MPQIMITPPLAGLEMGFANRDGGGSVKIFAGKGDPNDASNDSAVHDLAQASTGSLYLRSDGSTSTSLFVKTDAGIPGSLGTWTAK